MALSRHSINKLFEAHGWHYFASKPDMFIPVARAIEAEVHKQDDVLIRQMLEALAKASVPLRIGHDKLVATDETAAAITAAKARQGINT